jgi:hypothetical protein
MYCEKCGTKCDDDSIFCVKCGTNISRAKTDIGVSSKSGETNPKKGIWKIVTITFVLLILLSVIVLSIWYVKTKNSVQGQNIVNVSITSIPPGANVYINDTFKGKTPIIVGMREGDYHLKMNITGYKSIMTDISMTSDMYRQDVQVKFENISSTKYNNTI